MAVLRGTQDEMEGRERQYANIQGERAQLHAALQSLLDRKKNMQLVNDQVGGWAQRVTAKMQEQL